MLLLLAGLGLALAGSLIAFRAGRAGGWLLAAISVGLFGLGLMAKLGDPWVAPWIPQLGVDLAFRMTEPGRLLWLVVTGIGAAIFVYAGGYLVDHPQRNRCVGLLGFFMTSMLGLSIADDVYTLFVFWELTSLTSYLLIGLEYPKEKAREAARQAFLLTGAGGLALLAGLVLLSQSQGTSRIGEMSGAMIPTPALVLIVLGAMAKSAQAPLHFWLPNAMAAPTPVSAYLHSATMVKAGVYLLMLLAPVLATHPMFTPILQVIGVATAIVGAVLAFQAPTLKRMLAGTTVAALGTLVATVGLGTKEALATAGFFLVGHALYKAALFMVAGEVVHATHESEWSKISGLRRAMPLTFVAATMGAIGLAGFGPTVAFIGKEYILKLAPPWMVFGLAVSFVLQVICAWRLGWHLFVGPPQTAHPGPLSISLPPLVLGIISLAGALLPGLIEGVVPSSNKHFKLFDGWTLPLFLSLGIFLLGTALDQLRFRFPVWEFADDAYQGFYRWLLKSGKSVGEVMQRPAIRNRVALTLLVLAVPMGIGLWEVGLSQNLTLDRPSIPALMIAALIVGGVAVTVVAPTRISSVVALGVAGFGTSLFFLYAGAPDLAITQLAVETLTVILFVLVFHYLPRINYYATRHVRFRDGALAVVVGLAFAGTLLAVQDPPNFPAAADFYAERSVPEGRGRNIVNVILVDFRALDTLGEITVLGVAALGVAALLRRRPKEVR